MNGDDSDFDKLCKILALTNSDKPGEALAAFQSAKRMLLRQGLSFEDILANHFDGSGNPIQQQIAILKNQKKALQRELAGHKKAMDDLLKQLWELREKKEAGLESGPQTQPEFAIETIKETYRANLCC